MTRQVSCGGVPIGGGATVSVQSMTNTDTRDVEATLAQIRALAAAGCDIVRVAVHDARCAEAVRPLVDASPVPLVADIHFDYRLAIEAMEGGIQKLRINPGNIGGRANVQAVADCAKVHGVPIRIGVNSGSVERSLLEKHGGPTPQAMVESALGHARLLEAEGFEDIVISAKASGVRETVAAYRALSDACDYPLHLGVTEAGLPGQGTVKSAIGIGALLLDGIGDTIRVSLSGDPLAEPAAALDILRALGLRDGVDVISCPTCGRTEGLDVAAIARRVAEETRGWDDNIRVAVMGCVVNGPGEAREADLGIAGGRSGCVLFRQGEPPQKIEEDPEAALIDALREFRRKRA
ncbi:flavodoxin-dependent (E)-4-hydroxy-3-methylbut-2-enyl-diphosphate synthase [Eubacteriales bacterium OttesenSCG-928-A19]|nr:flavodoxin-dependent (E)-4-hydroxy-3-methylbut-2-enyl-diphosphate synthase [Eubacteriales bacterium OttesenSCG-928-A19]